MKPRKLKKRTKAIAAKHKGDNTRNNSVLRLTNATKQKVTMLEMKTTPFTMTVINIMALLKF